MTWPRLRWPRLRWPWQKRRPGFSERDLVERFLRGIGAADEMLGRNLERADAAMQVGALQIGVLTNPVVEKAFGLFGLPGVRKLERWQVDRARAIKKMRESRADLRYSVAGLVAKLPADELPSYLGFSQYVDGVVSERLSRGGEHGSHKSESGL